MVRTLKRGGLGFAAFLPCFLIRFGEELVKGEPILLDAGLGIQSLSVSVPTTLDLTVRSNLDLDLTSNLLS